MARQTENGRGQPDARAVKERSHVDFCFPHGAHGSAGGSSRLIRVGGETEDIRVGQGGQPVSDHPDRSDQSVRERQPAVRNGYRGISVVMTVAGDAPAEELARLVERSERRSAVLDVLTNGTAVDIEVRTG